MGLARVLDRKAELSPQVSYARLPEMAPQSLPLLLEIDPESTVPLIQADLKGTPHQGWHARVLVTPSSNTVVNRLRFCGRRAWFSADAVRFRHPIIKNGRLRSEPR
jgi:hypothetical protein